MTETFNLGDKVQKAQFWWGTDTDHILVRDIARNLAQHYLGLEWSKTRWKKQKTPLVCRWRSPIKGMSVRHSNARDPTEYNAGVHESAPLNLEILSSHIIANKGFQPESLRLPPPRSPWLDTSLQIGRRFPAPGNSGKQNLQFRLPMTRAFGPNFPIHPRIDREGLCTTNMQGGLLRRVAESRIKLVEKVGALKDEEWLLEFRLLVTDVVSWMDITLNTLCLKAQFDPLPGWKFNPSVLGSRIVKLDKKFDWIRLITGSDPSANEATRKAFDRIRKIRNHLHHFDPPCFAFTYEEAAAWLNDVRRSAIYHFCIRDHLGEPATIDLITLMMQPDVEFRSSSSGVPHRKYTGYRSTSWEHRCPLETQDEELWCETNEPLLLFDHIGESGPK